MIIDGVSDVIIEGISDVIVDGVSGINYRIKCKKGGWSWELVTSK